MVSIILATASRYLLPLMLIFSFFLLLRGHNEPGGGFVGGLVAAAAYALYLIANGIEEAKKLLKTEPIKLIPLSSSGFNCSISCCFNISVPPLGFVNETTFSFS